MSKNKRHRKIDKAFSGTQSYLNKSLVFAKKASLRTWKILFIVAFAIGSIIALVFSISLNLQTNSFAESRVTEKSPLMKRVLHKGCVADGLLSAYGGDTEQATAMINRSECQYLHRSLETWAHPPDFEKAQAIKARITKPDIIFGMFLAEAIGVKSKYANPFSGKKFKFNEMCRAGSEGFWGENTCKANFASEEYRQYLRAITRAAIDMDIQSFMFGQIHFQDNLKNPVAPAIVLEMRQYAQAKGKQIIIGAQTNDIDNSDYLKIFDYIEGGVGLNNDGRLEKNECSSRWWKKPGDRCWALVWHEHYAKRANDVLVHFDWSGLHYDDMSTFARMDHATRQTILQDMDAFYEKRGAGFMYPFISVIYDKNGGCYGPQKNYYSPNNIYSCKDEDTINEILRNNVTGEEPVTPTTEPAPITETVPATEVAPTAETVPAANTAPTTEPTPDPATAQPAPETVIEISEPQFETESDSSTPAADTPEAADENSEQ